MNIGSRQAAALSGLKLFQQSVAKVPIATHLCGGDDLQNGGAIELLAAALSASVDAHLCGGDVTEGAIDDSIRHAITKLSFAHFPTNEESARRIVQMGEDPREYLMWVQPGSIELCPPPVYLGRSFWLLLD